MSKLLTFKWIAYDSRLLQSNVRQSFTLFNANHKVGDNETKQYENEMVSWLVAQRSFRELLLGELEMPFFTNVFCQLKKPFITTHNNKPGDIDILLINPQEPAYSIAIECKKVNVTTSLGSDKINKIDKIKGAINQTESLLEMGFHKVYLAIITGSYGAENTDVNYFYRGMGEQYFHKLYDFPDREKLDSRVGLIFVEVILPTGNSLNHTVVLCLCIDKFAKEQEQSRKITENIKLISY